MHKVHITLPELQAIVLMLHRMAFSLSGKVVVLPLDNNIPKAYICDQDDTAYLFLPRLAICILNMANKHGFTVYSSIHNYPSQRGS